MKTVFKYPLRITEVQEIPLPRGAYLGSYQAGSLVEHVYEEDLVAASRRDR